MSVFAEFREKQRLLAMMSVKACRVKFCATRQLHTKLQRGKSGRVVDGSSLENWRT